MRNRAAGRVSRWGLVLGVSTLAPGCVDSAQILEDVSASAPNDGTGGGLGGAGGLVPGPLGSVIQVDGGDVHTCAVVDGALYCWGGNQTGGLGLGDVDTRDVPTRVGSSGEWTLVGSGNGFSCGIRSGDVFCWGAGTSGQLGDGQFSSALVPKQVVLPAQAAELGVGHDHVCAVLSDGRLYCWGNNTEGQLAQDDPFPGAGVNSALPLQVGSNSDWKSVSSGQGHTCGVRLDGSLWCWGRNLGGELGLGAGSLGQIRVPTRVGVASDWLVVAAGQNHTCGVRAPGRLHCWGDNSHFQLGFVGMDVAFEPTELPSPSDVAQISVDTFHSCATEKGGRLSCWGRNIEGQLGNGTLEASNQAVPAIPRDAWTHVTVARFHTCGARNRALFCTGANADGRLGTGDTARRQEFSATVF